MVGGHEEHGSRIRPKNNNRTTSSSTGMCARDKNQHEHGRETKHQLMASSRLFVNGVTKQHDEFVRAITFGVHS